MYECFVGVRVFIRISFILRVLSGRRSCWKIVFLSEICESVYVSARN